MKVQVASSNSEHATFADHSHFKSQDEKSVTNSVAVGKNKLPIFARINVPLRLTLLTKVLNKQAINSSKLSNQYLLMSSDWRCQLKNYFTIRQYTNTEKLLLHNSPVSGLLSVYILLLFMKKLYMKGTVEIFESFHGKTNTSYYVSSP